MKVVSFTGNNVHTVIYPQLKSSKIIQFFFITSAELPSASEDLILAEASQIHERRAKVLNQSG